MGKTAYARRQNRAFLLAAPSRSMRRKVSARGLERTTGKPAMIVMAPSEGEKGRTSSVRGNTLITPSVSSWAWNPVRCPFNPTANAVGSAPQFRQGRSIEDDAR
jgi:hypothetical protein